MAENFWFTECDRCECTGDQFQVKAASPYIVIALMRDHFLQEHELECAFCFLKFAGFKELAEHVNDAHTSPDAQAERLQREAWHPNDDKENDMLPAPGGGKRASERESGGGGGGRGRAIPKVPFLRVEDFSGDTQETAKILGVQAGTGTGFNDVIVKVAIRGKSYFFGLKASNPNYEALFNGLGDDENKWVGEEFIVGLNYNEFYEKQFVHVFEAPAKKKAGARKEK